MDVLIFDIETGANENAHKFIKPFDKTNPDHVKYGNTKDPEKRAEIEKQAYAIYMSYAEKHFALSAVTGKILAISYSFITEGKEPQIWVSYLQEGTTEKDLISELWDRISDIDVEHGIIVGFNNKKFDIPFVVQRSWILNIPTYPLMEGRWYKNFIIDLYEVWNLGNTNNLYKYISSSLKSISECLGTGTKSDDGENFGKIFFKDKEKALMYAENDIILTTALYNRLKDFIRVKEIKSDIRGVEDI